MLMLQIDRCINVSRGHGIKLVTQLVTRETQGISYMK